MDEAEDTTNAADEVDELIERIADADDDESTPEIRDVLQLPEAELPFPESDEAQESK